MPKRYAARMGRAAVRYGIVIRGTIAQPLTGPLERMTVSRAGDETILVGDIVDQAQLHGVIRWLCDLGVEIVSVNPLRPRAGDR
jgi:hypothetical protein